MLQDVLTFWFEDIKPSQWWKKDPDLDNEITLAFGDIHRQATQCELYLWRQTPAGRLAEILVLDQFSRNIHRNSPQAFAADSQALALAQEAVAGGADTHLSPTERNFLYMPYMHSESAEIHNVAVSLFSASGLTESQEYELKHKVIIDRFGRYPHRNAILGRESTPAEIKFLKGPNSSF